MIRDKRKRVPRRVLYGLRKLAADTELTIDSINHGGCAVFAALVARRLRKLGVEAECAVYGEKGVFFGRESFPHVAVALPNGLDYDSTGLRLTSQWRGWERLGTLPPDHVKRLAANPHVWNDAFDRGQMPTLGRLIRRHLPLEGRRARATP